MMERAKWMRRRAKALDSAPSTQRGFLKGGIKDDATAGLVRERKAASAKRRNRKAQSGVQGQDAEGVEDQAALCKWMDEKGYVYFAIPNDGERSIGMAVKAAATGLKKGVPDLCIAMPRAPYHGLYIELKRVTGGTVSEYQREWIRKLRAQGYRAEVCKGYDAAVRVLEEYFHAG